jgi:large subunit ribosomal protein L31
MKTQTHPTWFPEAQVKCACGNVFVVGATQEKLEIEVCSNCHPFYTGQMKYLDTAGRVDAFKERQKHAAKKVLSKSSRRKIKREKRLSEELDRPDSLEELRNRIKKAGKKKTSKKLSKN